MGLITEREPKLWAWAAFGLIPLAFYSSTFWPISITWKMVIGATGYVINLFWLVHQPYPVKSWLWPTGGE